MPQSINQKTARVDFPLAGFIRKHGDQVILEWTEFARTSASGKDMTKLQLEDHIRELLTFIADDLETAQSGGEQIRKSQGIGPDHAALVQTAAQIHAALRYTDGFDLDELVSEYRALRASIIKLWTAEKTVLDNQDVEDLTRFNEAIDQTLTESISQFTKTLDESRNIFLGILSHDLRTPLGASSMSAELISHSGELNERQKTLTDQVIQANSRAAKIVFDLLELTQAGFRNELPMKKSPADLGIITAQIVKEVRAFSNRVISMELLGKLDGEWDASRMGQVLSNLLHNAVQYSQKDSPIHVSMEGDTDTVTICVQNIGQTIPSDKLNTIFDPFRRGNLEKNEPGNLGLGLYIAKKIVTAHGGKISVTADEEKGTKFTIILPRSTASP